MEIPLQITPFLISIDAETLSDLRKRIRNTRWPDSGTRRGLGAGDRP